MLFPGLGGGMASSAEEQRLMSMLQELQLTDSIRTFTDLINRCFGDCVHSFRSSTLDGKEDACVRKCSEKFVKFSARAAQKFQELQQEMTAKIQAQQGTQPQAAASSSTAGR